MKLCIPTVDNRRLQGRLSAHFGSAPYFTLVDSETGSVEVVENHHAEHGHGTCEPSAALENRRVDAVICSGLGRRAFARLNSAGIAVYVSDSAEVSTAVEAFRAGTLRRLTADEACHGGHRHGHAD